MPTSETGSFSAAPPPAASRGFSLLELLVVVAIIGILAGAVVLSLGNLGNDRELREETDRLKSLLNLLHEESIMQSRDYGLLMTATGYRFYVYDYAKRAWAEPLGDKLLQAYDLHPQLTMTLLLDGREVELARDFRGVDTEKPAPQILLLSSGESTPFSLEMLREGRPGRFEMTGELNGTLRVTEEGFDGR